MAARGPYLELARVLDRLPSTVSDIASAVEALDGRRMTPSALSTTRSLAATELMSIASAFGGASRRYAPGSAGAPPMMRFVAHLVTAPQLFRRPGSSAGDGNRTASSPASAS